MRAVGYMMNSKTLACVIANKHGVGSALFKCFMASGKAIGVINAGCVAGQSLQCESTTRKDKAAAFFLRNHPETKILLQEEPVTG